MRWGWTSDIIQLITENTANSIFSLALKSSVQILLFIAGLQSISWLCNEAAVAIDGCTAWVEKYWKITFPMLSSPHYPEKDSIHSDRWVSLISSGNLNNEQKLIQAWHNVNFARWSPTLAIVFCDY